MILISWRTKFFKQYNNYLSFFIIVNLFFIILSITGKYPWSLKNRYDIATNAIFVLSFFPLFLVIINFINKIIKNEILAQLIFVCTFILLSINSALSYKFIDNVSIYNNYCNCMINKDAKILANKEAMPTIRYLFEYGALKNNNDIYQNIIYFEEDKKTKKYSQKTFDEVTKFDYIILTHQDDYSVLPLIIENSNIFIDCSSKNPSKMYKRR